jgi:hypothetical protein
LEALTMRDLLLTYIFRPVARPLTRLIVSLMAVPALQFLFRHVSTLERLDDELEKDLAEWFRGSFLLLLVTANIEAALWHNVIPFPDLLDKHGWLGLGLRIMLAIGVVQLMPDQELFSVIHPGPRIPHFKRGRSQLRQIVACWKPLSIGFLCQHLSRSSPVFAILAVIFTGTVGWVCYGLAIVQYLIIGLATSRARAVNVLLLFDEQVAVRRRELIRQFGVIKEFARHEAAFDQEPVESNGQSPCGD